MEKKRFEYIDAMRGFTMLLVVCAHVATYSYQTDLVTFHAAFSTFRMPLFFFISGFILYKASRTLAIAVMVVSLCLVVSNVMRLSPWMSQYLFGVKPKKE